MIEYIGTRYAGFQRQPGQLTVQSALEEAVSTVTQEPTSVVGSGRTDAGAHAVYQVIAFATASTLPTHTLGRAINARLPRDIAVTSVWDAAPEFHPRFDALSRTYRYVIWNRGVRSPFLERRAAQVRYQLDERQMDKAAQLLIGRHNMSAFVPAAAEGELEREFFTARCWRDGEIVNIELEATGFMRQMARSIAGTLIRVGAGRIGVEEFGQILASRRRELAADTAPACGLYLVRVRYPGNDMQTPSTSDRLPWLGCGPYEETP